MRDRWDEEEELERGRGRRTAREPEPEPTLGELIEGSVRKLVTGMVIAGALIGLGVYGSGRGADSGPDYQVATSPDGRIVYRITSSSGRILACDPGGTHCWTVLSRGQDLDDGPPTNIGTAPPAPVQAQPAPAQVAPAQPAAQLPAPQNTAAPAAR